MSKCLWCEGPVKTNTRNGKPRKYCSKVCSNEFYKERDKNKLREKLDPPTPCKACGTLVERFLSNKPKKYCSEKCSKDPQWMKRLKKNAWIDEYCVSKEEAAEQIGVHTATITNRMNKLSIKAHWKTVDGQSYVYVRKIDIDPIKNINSDKKIPDGFANKEQAAEILGIKASGVEKKIYKLKKKIGYSPVEKIYVQVLYRDNKSIHTVPVYKIEDLLKIKNKYRPRKFNCDQCGKLVETMYPDKVYCSKVCSKAAAVARRRARIADENISLKECVELFPKLGILGDRPAPRTFLQNNKVAFGFIKKLNTYYIPETQFDSFIKRFRKAYSLEKQIRELEKQDVKLRQHRKIIRRTVEQNEWEYQERLLFFRLNEKILRCKEKWGIDSPQFQDLIMVQTKRFSYLTDYWSTGEIAKAECSSCNVVKPFYEFHTSTKSSLSKALDTQACKACISEKGKVKRELQCPDERKKYRQKNYRVRLRTLVAVSIRNKINKTLGRYINGLGVPPTWRALEERCGYTIDDLIKHIEDQFTPNMNWGNQSTPRSPGEYGWHMDHIKPHNSFNYDSFDHPEFAKCWALENLRPLSAVMNLQKGDKNLYMEHTRTFRDGVKSEKPYNKGIWKFLPYSNLVAKKYIEKNFDVGMTWENYGKFWQIDHIDPLAHLAYLGESDKNFEKAWSLENLQPLERSENSSKSSIFEEQLWFHNYVDQDMSLS